MDCPREQGVCLNANGEYPSSGVTLLTVLNGDAPEQEYQCLKLCTAVEGVTGCEVIWENAIGKYGEGGKCNGHTLDVASGNGTNGLFCWILSKCSK